MLFFLPVKVVAFSECDFLVDILNFGLIMGYKFDEIFFSVLGINYAIFAFKYILCSNI